MINSEIIKIPKINNFDNVYVEAELANLGFNIVRWAVVEVGEYDIAISFSYFV